jgi:hypothetical protein
LSTKNTKNSLQDAALMMCGTDGYWFSFVLFVDQSPFAVEIDYPPARHLGQTARHAGLKRLKFERWRGAGRES